MTLELSNLLKERLELANIAINANVSQTEHSRLYQRILTIKQGVRKFSKEEISKYEETYSVKFPNNVKEFLLEYGTDGYLRHSIIDFGNTEIRKPDFYMSNRFFKVCIKNNIPESIIDEFNELYNPDANTFKNELLDKVFENELNREIKEIHKLLFLRGGTCAGDDNYLCLSGDYPELVVYIGGWADKKIRIGDNYYSRLHYGTFNESYFHYLEKLIRVGNEAMKEELKSIERITL